MYMFDVHEISKITPQREKSECKYEAKNAWMWGRLKATKLHLYLILALCNIFFCMCKFIMHEVVVRKKIVGCDNLRFENAVGKKKIVIKILMTKTPLDDF